MPGFKASGGCQCGAVRYEIDAPVDKTEHCHCGMCRKVHGVIMVTFATVDREHFKIVKGADNLATFHSSAKVHRNFCKTCGAHIYIDSDDHPDAVEFSAGTLDGGAHPGHREEALRHIYYKFKVPWLEVHDDLPKADVT